MEQNICPIDECFAVSDRQCFGIGRALCVGKIGGSDRFIQGVQRSLSPVGEELPRILYLAGGVPLGGGGRPVKAEIEVSIQTGGGTFKVKAKQLHSQIKTTAGRAAGKALKTIFVKAETGVLIVMEGT